MDSDHDNNKDLEYQNNQRYSGGNRGGHQRPPRHIHCFNCGEVGHVSYNCTQPQARKTCYNCGEPGHVSRDCPQERKAKTCYVCNQVGHIAIECPNRK